MAAAAAAAETGDCAGLRSAFDSAVRHHRVGDPRYQRLRLDPWLRSDRFHMDALGRALEASRDPTPILVAMAEKDRRATERERTRLPADPAWDPEALAACRADAIDRTRARLETDARLRERVSRQSLPDAYRSWQRLLGGYVFARPFLRLGAQRWRLGEHRLQQEQEPPQALLRWRPPAGPAWDEGRVAARLAAAAAAHPMGWPWPDAADRSALLHLFAPVLDSPSDAPEDRIGRLAARAGRAYVDVEQPTAYAEAGLVRLDSEVLLQLSYTFWFPERSPEHPLDPYAGPIDGLVWRVTLDRDGRALLWDSIHACGCYYTLILPADAPIVFRNPEPVSREDPLVLVGPGATSRVRITASAGAHFLRWPMQDAADGPEPNDPLTTGYVIRPYAELLEAGDQRPPFRPDGLLSGTSRLERLFLFPAGITDPGAMRSHGHHATAFLGRRHFDDPELASGMVQRVTAE